MAFPDKKPKAALAISIGDDEPEMPSEGMDDMPADSKTAAVKALFSAFKAKDWQGAADALGQFIDSHDDESGMDDEMPEPTEDEESSPF